MIGLARGSRCPPALVLSLDQASIGFAMIWFLNYHLSVRIIAMHGTFHSEWNDVMLALSDDNLWWVILMSTMVYNMPHGP